MPIEIKVLLLFGLGWVVYEYVKQSIIKSIKENEKLKWLYLINQFIEKLWKPL